MLEQVKDKIFFHINRKLQYSKYDFLKKGEIIHIGKTFNPFFNYYEIRKEFPIDWPNGITTRNPAMNFLSLVKAGKINCPDLPNISHEIAEHFMLLARESIFENIRTKDFSDFPSRQRCIWLLRDEGEVAYWWKRLKCKSESQWVKLSATGKAFYADARFLHGDSEPISQSIAKARKYWRGVVSDIPELEAIFEGELRVLEVLKAP